jgi:hypothetical protein
MKKETIEEIGDTTEEIKKGNTVLGNELSVERIRIDTLTHHFL